MTAFCRVDPRIWVLTPKGEGYAHFLIDYGPDDNTVWVVSLIPSGNVIHVDSAEIRVMHGNEMYNVPMPEPFDGRNMESYGEEEV